MKRYIRSEDILDDDASLDEDWDYDEFNGEKYFVYGTDHRGDTIIETTSDPNAAISIWFKVSRHSDGYIMARTRNDAIDLVAAGTSEFLTKLYNRYGSRYKLDYLIDACNRQYSDKCPHFYEGELGDQVFPFCVG